jgi:hypothetical protein
MVNGMGSDACCCLKTRKGSEWSAMDALKKAQATGLWWAGHAPLRNDSDAVRFLKEVRLALRYNATPSLPLAAIHKAAGDVRRSSELQNALLASGEAIETNLIAGRLVFLHRSLAPAVYALRRRKSRPLTLSSNAARAFGWIQSAGHASSGDVRRFLGVYGLKRPDAGDEALSELQRELLIDRGPATVPKKGIPYLPPEGFPYRVFEQAHPDVIRAAAKLTLEKATIQLLESCLEAAVWVTPQKLASMFKLLLSAEEIAAVHSDKIERTRKMWLWR